MIAKPSQESLFESLLGSVQYCDLCRPNVASSGPVLSKANGNPHARVLFIAEAPGRLGAARTGIPLHGDVTGNNFERLMESAGIRREDVFITNAVLCNPLDESGNNRSPKRREVKNCSAYLEMTLNLLKPAVVVSLGAVALTALDDICSHGLRLSAAVGRAVPWRNTLLFPMYHPGPRAMLHRGFDVQLQDYLALASIIQRAIPTK